MSHSRWRKMKPGTEAAMGVCTCAWCLRAIDAGEEVTCASCVAEQCVIAYADGRKDGRDGSDE